MTPRESGCRFPFSLFWRERRETHLADRPAFSQALSFLRGRDPPEGPLLPPLRKRAAPSPPGPGRGCGNAPCICGEDWPLKGVYPAFEYRDGAAWAIRQMKFHNRPAIARRLAVYLAEALPEALPVDAIVPIPMRPAAIRKRGYNQAALLARFLSEEIGVPWAPLLIKSRKTRPQHTLNARERRANLSGAYRLAEGADVRGKVLLLCDDVTTTGSTLREAANVLLRNGAAEVHAVTAATTIQEVSADFDEF